MSNNENEGLTQEQLIVKQKELKEKEMILIRFTADWCGPCKLIDNMCKEYEAKFPDSIKYLTIDIDDSLELYMKLKKHKQVNGIPSLLAYYNYEGEKDVWYTPNDSHVGADNDVLRDFFERCLRYVKVDK